MRSYPRLIGALGLLACLGLGGCSSWFTGRYQDPQIELIKVEVVKAKLLEQRFVLHFRIDNPNDSRLPIRGLTYRLYLGDVLLGEGEADDWSSVQPHARRTYRIPLRTNLWQQLKPLAKMLRQHHQAIPYRLEGELRTGLLFGHDLQLKRSGEILPGNILLPE